MRTAILFIIFIVILGVIILILQSRINTKPQEFIGSLETPLKQNELVSNSLPQNSINSSFPSIRASDSSSLSSSDSELLLEESDPQIADILLGDNADENGFITESNRMENINGIKNNIYVTVKVNYAEVGSLVWVEMFFDEGTSKAGPIEGKVEKEGNIMKPFVFKGEGDYWPAGKYIVNVQLSTGDKKSIEFNVMK